MKISILIIAIVTAASTLVAQQKDDKLVTFFMGRVKYSANDGKDCNSVGKDLMKLVSKASTLKMQDERRVELTDPALYETPFLFLNGHNEFKLTAPEIENLRQYFSRDGFFFASGCCTNPKFPQAWRAEFGRILPGETVKPIDYDHLVYRAFYKIDRVRCLNENRDIKLEGLFFKATSSLSCARTACAGHSARTTSAMSAKGSTPRMGAS